MKIGDLFLALGVDSADFKTAVTKEAEAAGKAGSAKLSSTMAAGLKVGSLVVGAAFGLMAKGAIEMEKAQGKFQAATGRSREEAIEFSKAMNGIVGSAKTVGASFEEISDTGIAVSQQFDITGQKATDLTEDILGFAKVTGQDASDAALQLEDTLSAFGLSADDASGFMDQLVASSQKFGTDAGPATLSILQGMAPALQAMGMNLGDGVELLNAFEVAGLDAGSAQRGLQSAIAELKPGQNLDDLIAQIGAIEDPTLRAQKAIEIFGTRAGAGLAAVIQPGMTSLDDFAVSAEDAAGAADRAAEDMLTTSDKIRMFTEKAGGFLRGLGQDFGPVVTGLASLASLSAPFARGIVGLFTSLLRHAGILAAATAVGTATGGAQAVGHEVAATGPSALRRFLMKFGLMTPVLVGAATVQGTATGTAQGTASAVAMGGPAALGKARLAGRAVGIAFGIAAAAGAVFIGAELGEAFWRATVETPEKLRVLMKDYLARALGGDVATWSEPLRQGMSDAVTMAMTEAYAQNPDLELVKQAGQNASLRYYDGVMAGITEGMPEVRATFDAAWSKALSEGATTTEARLAAEAAIAGMVDSFNAGVPALTGAGDDAGTAVVNHWTRAQQRQLEADRATTSAAFAESVREAMLAAQREAAWGGAQTPREFAQGARSSFDVVRSAFSDLKDLMKNTLSPVQKEAELIGIATSKRLAKALEDGRPEVRGEAQQIALDTIAELHALNPASTKIGDLTTLLLARALPNERPALQTAINQIVGVVTTPLGTLPGIAETAGADIGGALARGLRSKYGSVTTAAENLAGIIRGRLELGSPAKKGPWSKKGGPEAWLLRAGQRMSAALEEGLHTRDITPPLIASLTAPGFTLPSLGNISGTGTINLHHTVDIKGDASNLDERKVADYLNEGAAGFAWNLEHAMSAVTSG